MGFFFLCDSSLLVYRKVTDFCILILYPATLPDSLISNSFFLVETLRFFIYSIMSSTNINSFTSPPPIWMPFISFSCLIAVTGTSNNTLNRNSKCGYHCLVFEFKGKAFSFSPLSLMLAGFVINGLYYVEIRSLCTHFDEGFFFYYHEWMLNFVKCFFCVY